MEGGKAKEALNENQIHQLAGSKLNNYSNWVLQTSSGKYLILPSALQHQCIGSTTAIICGPKRHRDVSSLKHCWALRLLQLQLVREGGREGLHTQHKLLLNGFSASKTLQQNWQENCGDGRQRAGHSHMHTVEISPIFRITLRNKRILSRTQWFNHNSSKKLLQQA